MNSRGREPTVTVQKHIRPHGVAPGTKLGIHFKSAKIRGGGVENISIRDVTRENVERPVNFEMNWYPAYSLPTLPPELQHIQNPPRWAVLLQPVLPASRGIPEVRNVFITNLRATGAKIAFAVNGFPDKPISDVRLANVEITAASAGSIRHASDWRLTDVAVKSADGKPVNLVNCQDVEMLRLILKADPTNSSATPKLSMHNSKL